MKRIKIDLLKLYSDEIGLIRKWCAENEIPCIFGIDDDKWSCYFGRKSIYHKNGSDLNYDLDYMMFREEEYSLFVLRWSDIFTDLGEID